MKLLARLKTENRILGIDDGPFNKFKDKDVIVVGVVFRGGHWMDGVLSTRVAVDGTDATTKLIRIINRSKFKSQLRAIMFKGIALGGFNVIDFKRLYKSTKIPIIIVIRKYPRFNDIYRALKKLKKNKEIKIIQGLPKPIKMGKIWVQAIGTRMERAKEMLELTCTRAEIPEPLRAAHLIAAGVVKGESRGRA